ncbi:MAG TPA: serine hydrolase domain-containing protein [Thermoanaerobaculia bacterium]|nr:serine hydrolase domain-containing protein [Thermoanaerobaculia bacterium]
MISTGTATAVAALVGTADEILFEFNPETRFDYASLSKPFAFTLALVLDQQRLLPLGTPLRAVFPKANRRLAARPVSDLLRHRSGLAAWAPLYHLCPSRKDVLPFLLDERRMRPTRRAVYGDLDILLYGLAVEQAVGLSYAHLLRTFVLNPLGLASVEPAPADAAPSFMDTGQEVKLAAKLGLTIPLQGPPPPGQPQDGNARFLKASPPAHAGLFGNVRDLWRLGSEWLAPRKLLKREATAAALTGSPFYLGWWRRSRRGSAGPALSPGSFGHTGFAGGSLWIDPERQRVLVLLSHRADPFSNMNRWRRRFHAVAYSLIPDGGT